MNDSALMGLVLVAISLGTPLVYASVGEILAERSGILNLGVQGMMSSASACQAERKEKKLIISLWDQVHRALHPQYIVPCTPSTSCPARALHPEA